MFLDMLWISFDKDDVSDRYDKTLRGMWSHLNARKVSSRVVPVFSGFTVFFLCLLSPFVERVLAMDSPLFISYQSPNLLSAAALEAFVVAVILFTSGFLWYGERRPLRESTTLEYLFVRHMIRNNPQEFTEMVETLLETKARNG
jgi:hypothetical protein